ncbi:hypothetical protein A2U01_0062548, partial [Trifolium medium]|nr:hypothetical protein [Trifolium medium]
KKELEGPSWTMCIFPPEDLAEFPGGPKDNNVLTSYKAHFARYVYEGYITSSGTLPCQPREEVEAVKFRGPR